ncbi:MAG TPA: DUF481 domain-containing protein [Acidobacteriaceae bacterium]|jgi:hypothetical protein
MTFIRRSEYLFGLLLAFTVSATLACAQGDPPAPKPSPDVLVFANGDQLTGTLESGTGNSIVFKSDMAGEITVSLDKVKELRTGGSFAVLRKDVPIKTMAAARAITAGHITWGDGKLTVEHPSAPEAIPEAQISNIIEQSTFVKETTGKSGFLHGWDGTVNAGATVVRATDFGETFTAGIALVRSMPTVAFLPPRDRTTIDFQETYGKLTSPVIPQTTPPTPPAVTETSIFHADLERDQSFSPRFFVLATTAFDHNFAQGLDLQQIYGGGIGYVPLKDNKQELDLKATIQYEKQAFQTSSSNVNLTGSTLSETYHRILPKKFLLTELGSFIPAFNRPSDYSANASATLTLPVYKRLSLGFTFTDNYLNNPSLGFNRNSSQFIAAAAYTLK